LKSVSSEIGAGKPVSLKLTYRRQGDRPEHGSLFGASGVLAVRGSEFGDDFDDRVAEVAAQVQGDDRARRRALARLVNEGNILEVDADDIVGCSAVVRENGRERTIYFIGQNNFSTKFDLGLDVGEDGETDRAETQRRMIQVMRDEIIPLLS
jgi:hypothetical protein